jgi:hypothetical protein
MSNEAAERLLVEVCTCQAKGYGYPHKDFCAAFHLVEAAERIRSAERKATVERIRAAVKERDERLGLMPSPSLPAILDAEAAP